MNLPESGRQSGVSEPEQVDYGVHLPSEQQYGGLMGHMLDVVQQAVSMMHSEHQRPGYLVETNPDAIFGKIVAVAPPVIGEDPDVYQRDR